MKIEWGIIAKDQAEAPLNALYHIIHNKVSLSEESRLSKQKHLGKTGGVHRTLSGAKIDFNVWGSDPYYRCPGLNETAGVHSDHFL